MRQPKNQDELFHYWAHQVMSQARCGNVSFNGPILFSYAEPVAMLLDDDRVLISNRSFSLTTSSHQSAARQATNHRRCCYAPYLPRYGTAPHNDNRAHWERQAENALTELKLHPRRKKSVADKIASAVQSYNTYREFFELDWPEMTSDKMKKLVEESAKERAETERRSAERHAEQQRQREAEEAAELLFWRDHQTERRSFSKMALRLSLDGREIETTRGARVPVEVAPMLWRMASAAKKTNHSFVADSNHKVGVYRLDRINANGSLNIGCHHIPFDELELMAKKLNFITENSNGLE